jgi:hypothetical protein
MRNGVRVVTLLAIFGGVWCVGSATNLFAAGKIDKI